ncbi:MAG: acyl-CoA dehydrogenase family protein [Candidatus Hadarchaeales archaeon]
MGIMDFELKEEEELIRKLARDFASKEFPELKAGVEEGAFPFELWRKACAAKLVGPRIPEEYGGAGVSMLASILIQEEFCRVNPRLGEALASATLGSDLLIRFGTREQRERYLPPLAEGRARMGVVGIEEGRVFKACGERMEGEVELPSSPPPEYLVVAGWLGVEPSLVLVETEGKLRGRKLLLEGEMGEVIGEKGQAPTMIRDFLTLHRIERSGQALGTAEGALERALRYLEEREGLGKPAWDYSQTLRKLAEIKTEIEASRWLVYRAALSVDEGKCDQVLATMAEWKAGRTAVMAAEEAAMLHEGTWGHLEDYGVERFQSFSLLHPRFPPFSAQKFTPSRFLSEGLEEVERFLRKSGTRGVS